MLRNSAKAHWTLDELGWTLHPPGDHTEWDGLSSWFVQYMRSHPELTATAYLKNWLYATLDIRSELSITP